VRQVNLGHGFVLKLDGGVAGTVTLADGHRQFSRDIRLLDFVDLISCAQALAEATNSVISQEQFGEHLLSMSHAEYSLGDGTSPDESLSVTSLRDGYPRIIRAGDLPLSPARWLVGGFLPANCLALLVGREATYKSFLSLDLAASVATGATWANHPVERGAALYLLAEGQGGLRRRIRAWEIARQRCLDNLWVLPTTVDFGDSEAIAQLENEIRALEPQPSFIVVDTLARYMGGEENAASDSGRFIAACDRLRNIAGATILVVHHESKSGGYRGSSALVHGRGRGCRVRSTAVGPCRST